MDQDRNLVKPPGKDPPERIAFAPPVLNQGGEHRAETRYHGGLYRTPFVLAFLGVDHLNDALDRENSIESRSIRIDAIGQRLHCAEHRVKHLLVEAHDRRLAMTLDTQGGVD